MSYKFKSRNGGYLATGPVGDLKKLKNSDDDYESSTLESIIRIAKYVLSKDLFVGSSKDIKIKGNKAEVFLQKV